MPHPRKPRNPASHTILRPKEWTRIANTLALSPRELEVIQSIFDGHSESGIAFLLNISAHTVHTYIKRIYAKLSISDHRELVLRVFIEHLSPG